MSVFSASHPIDRNRLLTPGPGNPRNSEGAFIRLRDGRIVFIYSRFTGGGGRDDGKADLAQRVSEDGGRSWSKQDQIVVESDGGLNVMSVSLLRLQDERLAMFYARKDSVLQCRPFLRFSTDDADTWSTPVPVIPDTDSGYYVLNNDRVIQLASGRLLVPVAQHSAPGWGDSIRAGADVYCYYSDDVGQTWHRSQRVVLAPGSPQDTILQEPGVVALRDGRVMMFARTNQGSQFVCYSPDGGRTWGPAGGSTIRSPLSPASIKRIPSTSDLLLIWNGAGADGQLTGKRTPLYAAISRDEARTWGSIKSIETDPHGWYCYTAIEFVENRVFLAHVASSPVRQHNLEATQITSFDLDWLYS